MKITDMLVVVAGSLADGCPSVGLTPVSGEGLLNAPLSRVRRCTPVPGTRTPSPLFRVMDWREWLVEACDEVVVEKVQQ